MSRATLTSINKPHTDNIFTDEESRKKTVEWRTKPLPKGLHYVYETKNKGGCGKVIGEMTIVENIKYADVSAIPHEMILKGRFGARKLDIYANGRPLYANVIVNAKRYDKPKELWTFKRRGEYCDDCKSLNKDVHLCKKFGVYLVHNELLGWHFCCDECLDKNCKITHPPQSYCFVEEQ